MALALTTSLALQGGKAGVIKEERVKATSALETHPKDGIG